MVVFAPRSEAAMLRAHAEARQQRRSTEQPVPPPRNVRHLIDIGHDRVFFYRRATAFRVPPVPALAGLRVYELTRRLEVEEDTTARAPMLSELIALAETCVRPVGRWRHLRRLQQRLHLWHPFRDISEGELRGVADFLLLCRQSSSIRAL